MGEGRGGVAKRTGTLRSDSPAFRRCRPWNNAAEGRDHSSRHGPNRKTDERQRARASERGTSVACPLIQHPRGWRPRLDARVRVRAQSRQPHPHALGCGGGAYCSSYQCPVPGWAHPGPATPRAVWSQTPALGSRDSGEFGRAARGGGRRQRELLPPRTHTRAEGGRRRAGGYHHLAGLLLPRHATSQPTVCVLRRGFADGGPRVLSARAFASSAPRGGTTK